MMPGKQPERRPLDVPLAERWTAADCTLDGLPAIVCGRLNRYATVRALDPAQLDRTKPQNVAGIGHAIEMPWSAVDRVMREQAGRFYSGPRGPRMLR